MRPLIDLQFSIQTNINIPFQAITHFSIYKNQKWLRMSPLFVNGSLFVGLPFLDRFQLTAMAIILALSLTMETSTFNILFRSRNKKKQSCFFFQTQKKDKNKDSKIKIKRGRKYPLHRNQNPCFLFIQHQDEIKIRFYFLCSRMCTECEAEWRMDN